jgi:hypothetical protein
MRVTKAVETQNVTSKKHAAIAAICLLLALSPVGAPTIGMLIASVCPVDTTLEPDGPFAMPFHYCGISRPVEHQYQKAIFLPLVATVAAGRAVGVAIALAWVLAAIALPFAFLWNVVQAAKAWRSVED